MTENSAGPRRDQPDLGLADSTGDVGERERLLLRYGRRFVAGDAIFREGSPATEAFMLHEGRVRLLKRVRTIERSLMVLKPGDLFGESALLPAEDPERPSPGTSGPPAEPRAGRPGTEASGGRTARDEPRVRNSTAIALTDATALALDRETFNALLTHHPSVAMRVIAQLVRRLGDAEDQIEIMMLRDTQSKVVSALLKLARLSAASAPISGAVKLVVSPIELSTRVGLDVDAVKRAIQQLRDQQYLRIVGERIDIPDLEALRRLYLLLGTRDELRGA